DALPGGADAVRLLGDELAPAIESAGGAVEGESRQQREQAEHRAVDRADPRPRLGAPGAQMRDADPAADFETEHHADPQRGRDADREQSPSRTTHRATSPPGAAPERTA